MIEAFIVISLGLALEGVAYANATGHIRALLTRLAALPADRVRTLCAVGTLVGVGLLVVGPALFAGAAGHLIAAAGFVLAFEGAMWVVAPEQMQTVARMILHMDPIVLQRAGLVIGALGLITAAVMHFGVGAFLP